MRTLLHTACRRLMHAVLACIALATHSSPAFAVQISYQISGTASGTLGASSFVDAEFTLVGAADTNGVYQIPGLPQVVYANQLQSLTVSISGMGDSAATAPFSFFVNQSSSAAGFNDSTAEDAISVTAAGFATYSASTSLTALSVQPVYNAPFATANGILVFSSTSDLVFFASAVPESSQFALMVFGLVAMLLWRTGKHDAAR